MFMFFLLVGFHEWGHFYFAKRAGILVREFAIGFGPKLFTYKKGETRYTLRLFPIGGFVRMAGEDPELVQINSGQTIAVQIDSQGKVHRMYLDRLDEREDCIIGTVEHLDLEHELTLKLDVDEELQSFHVHPEAIMIARNTETQIAPWNRQFGSKSVGKRAMAIFAGPLMNFILAFILFFIFIYMTGIPNGEPTHLEIGQVVESSAASEAGLEAGDVIKSVNGEAVAGDSQKLIETISGSADQTMEWVIVRGDEEHTLQVTPKMEDGQGKVGITIIQKGIPYRNPTIGEAFENTALTMKNATEQIFLALKKLVTLQFKIDDLGGPVRITEVTNEAVSQGFNIYISWTAILSLYLGIFNLLPFPSLDGSRLLFIGLEALRRKPIDPNKEGIVHFIGFALLMVLMIAVTYNDILRLFKG
ncbi:RIP metalloprotease RseP [Marinicrinis lubricantis]|uniref:Zinc metalloprotease n=1 Tax=Marinicrinis lubricantis TaxID=2086470 RepID=A0ABW1IMB6_9BACL